MAKHKFKLSAGAIAPRQSWVPQLYRRGRSKQLLPYCKGQSRADVTPYIHEPIKHENEVEVGMASDSPEVGVANGVIDYSSKYVLRRERASKLVSDWLFWLPR